MTHAYAMTDKYLGTMLEDVANPPRTSGIEEIQDKYSNKAVALINVNWGNLTKNERWEGQ